MRYIGGKSLLLDNINAVIAAETTGIASALDIFAGSGVVSENFKKQGYRTFSNDFLYFSYAMLRGSLKLNKKPNFSNLEIRNPIAYLNQLKIEDTNIDIADCFIYNNYSPALSSERMYFQPANALKIDIIRITIQKWLDDGLIDEDGFYYLLCALLNAVPYVANITGVYAAYLKFWDVRTFNELELKEPEIFSNRKRNECFNLDYTELLSQKVDLLYADPPYNSREYLPNYHLLETIALYDYPEIKGVTGMRDYTDQKSVFCKKATVRTAFEQLVRDAKAKYILISYNNESLLSTEELSDICRTYAVADSFKLFEYDYRRYKNKIPNNEEGLKEQLYFLRRH